MSGKDCLLRLCTFYHPNTVTALQGRSESLQSRGSETHRGEEKRKKKEPNNFYLMAVFQICRSGCARKTRIIYTPVKVHTRWNGASCRLYLISPRGSRAPSRPLSWNAIDEIQNSAPPTKVLARGPGWTRPHVFLRDVAVAFPANYQTVSVTMSGYLLQEKGADGKSRVRWEV